MKSGYAGSASGGQFERCFGSYASFILIKLISYILSSSFSIQFNNSKIEFNLKITLKWIGRARIKIKWKSPQIGLDPAGIGYSIDYNGPPRGLNQTCCQHVQAIHTDKAIGSRQAMVFAGVFLKHNSMYFRGSSYSCIQRLLKWLWPSG